MTLITRFLPLATILFFSNLLFGQTRFYVNSTATGNNDGTSWANAYLDLQDALAASQYGNEIWVSQGTYYPTATTNRDIYYELKNGVKLYGGFGGFETDLSERDWTANETILSGDIGVQGDSLDNSYTILYISTSDSTTLVNGFIFRRGIANKFGNGSQASGSGAAIFINTEYSYPRIHNCRFEYNYARYFGGSVYVGGIGSIAPQFHNCIFSNNHAGLDGGAISIKQNTGDLAETKNNFWNCIFQENSAGSNGGAIKIDYHLANDTIDFIGCTFNYNYADGYGGGIHMGADFIKISDCTFTENIAKDNGSAFFMGQSNLTYLSITKSFFVSNTISGNSTNSTASMGHITTANFDTCTINISDCYFGFNYLNQRILLLAGFFPNVTNVILKDNTFESNSNLFSIGGYDKTMIDGCQFINNGTNISDVLITGYTKNLLITNSIFSKNKGILYNQQYQDATNTISNCTFYNNLGDTTSTQLFGNALIYNCIFNQEIGGNAFPFQAGNVTLESSLVLSPDCSNLPAYVSCGAGNLFGLAPVFADTAGGDFHLLPSSPGINGGNNAVANSLNLLSDYDGNPRINFCKVDMGALEAVDYELLNMPYSMTAACSNQTNGSVQFNFLNGCEPYTYNWTSDTNTGTGSIGLASGNYAFTITDANGKTEELQVEIPVYPIITADMDAIPYNCASGANGLATLNINGGAAPFQVEWYNGSTDTTLTNLLPGNYTVTVTDVNGCTLVNSVEIELQGNFSVGISVSPITCPGDADGSATVQPIGGAAPFTWLWQSGEDTPTIDSLSGGSYSATVTDANGCTGDIDFTMTPPPAIGIGILASDAPCFGQDGSATATPSGGTPGYDYLWSNGSTSSTAMLPAGLHGVTVTDSKGCTAVGSVTISEPPQLLANLSVQPPVLCHGASDGAIGVVPGGGTPPYDWGGPLENLPAGSYVVTVTDANGCTATATAIFEEHPEIAVTDSVADASSPTASDGSVTLTDVTGGTGSGYTFLWSNGTASQNLANVPTGDYTVTVTDSQGCTGTFAFFVDFGSAAGEVANPFGAAIVPNPSGGSGAKLVLVQAMPNLKIRVVDQSGRVLTSALASGKTFSLPNRLGPGTYRVVVENRAGRAVLTWVVVY